MDLVITGSTDYRHYIYAGATPVAVYSRKSTGTNTFSYFIADHQGSIASITNSSGAQVIAENFAAFGERRDAGTWASSLPNATDLATMAGITRQGYTFQTVLGDRSALNHMNGRIEDAFAGRFLSADPFVPDPTNTQSYNRYSYVNNNPLSFVDPSGFDGCKEQDCVKPMDPNYEADKTASYTGAGAQSGNNYGGNGDWQRSCYTIDGTSAGCSPWRYYAGTASPGFFPTPGSGGGHGNDGPSGGPSRPDNPAMPPGTQPSPIFQTLCRAGNALQSASAKGTALGQALETAGAVVAMIGGAAAGPDGAAPGAVLMGMGGATTLGSAGAQLIGGALQLRSDWSTGIQNVQAGAASLVAGGSFLLAPGFFGLSGSNYMQRAFNRNLDVSFAFGGAGVDAAGGLLPGMEPQQANCPEGAHK
jgi:RHS repeat-associated protein